MKLNKKSFLDNLSSTYPFELNWMASGIDSADSFPDPDPTIFTIEPLYDDQEEDYSNYRLDNNVSLVVELSKGSFEYDGIVNTLKDLGCPLEPDQQINPVSGFWSYSLDQLKAFIPNLSSDSDYDNLYIIDKSTGVEYKGKKAIHDLLGELS